MDNKPPPPPPTAEQKKIRQLHECNSKVYQIIDELNTIGVPVGLAYQDLRNATINIQKAIGSLIDETVKDNIKEE